MIVVAHRGSSAAAPENTLAAVETAIRSGASSIEVDVQLAADRVPVVIHDDTLDRTTDGSGPVHAVRSGALRTLDAGSWFGPEFTGERVPTLDDVLDAVSRVDRVHLLLELKGAWTVEDVHLVTEAVADWALADRVVVQSFSLATVAALATAAPWLRRGLIIVHADDGVLDLCLTLGATSCNPHRQVLRTWPGLVDAAHAAGMTVTPWTLNDPEEWAAAAALGVDGIITDRPRELADASLPA